MGKINPRVVKTTREKTKLEGFFLVSKLRLITKSCLINRNSGQLRNFTFIKVE